MKAIKFSFMLLACLMLLQCGSSDPRIAKPLSSDKQAFYDFMNDVRLEISDMEAKNLQLENFTKLTKSYLQSAATQRAPKLADMYHEKGLLRDVGAHNYADRFDTGGCVIRTVFYDDAEKTRCVSNDGVNKIKCRQVGKYHLLTQVFTANPVSEDLEAKINAIIDRNIEKHKAALAK